MVGRWFQRSVITNLTCRDKHREKQRQVSLRAKKRRAEQASLKVKAKVICVLLTPRACNPAMIGLLCDLPCSSMGDGCYGCRLCL